MRISSPQCLRIVENETIGATSLAGLGHPHCGVVIQALGDDEVTLFAAAERTTLDRRSETTSTVGAVRVYGTPLSQRELRREHQIVGRRGVGGVPVEELVNPAYTGGVVAGVGVGSEAPSMAYFDGFDGLQATLSVAAEALTTPPAELLHQADGERIAVDAIAEVDLGARCPYLVSADTGVRSANDSSRDQIDDVATL